MICNLQQPKLTGAELPSSAIGLVFIGVIKQAASRLGQQNDMMQLGCNIDHNRKIAVMEMAHPPETIDRILLDYAGLGSCPVIAGRQSPPSTSPHPKASSQTHNIIISL